MAIILTMQINKEEKMETDVSVLNVPPANAIEIHMSIDEILNFDVKPFVKRVWHGPQFKADWEERLRRAARLHHHVEYEMVKRGHRKAATIHLTGSTFDKEFERIQKDGMVWLPLVRTKSYNGFSHKHFPTHANDPNSSVYGVLACDMDAALAFKAASESSPVDHETIGDLLGFPPCCTSFFNEVWAQGFYDPIWQAAERTPGVKYLAHNHAVVEGSILCSQLLRYGGFRVTSHLPCSLWCEPSREIGRVWWDVGLDIDPEGAEALLRVMALKQNWSVLHGVAVIETPVFTMWTNSMPTKGKWTIDYTPKDVAELIATLPKSTDASQS